MGAEESLPETRRKRISTFLQKVLETAIADGLKGAFLRVWNYCRWIFVCTAVLVTCGCATTANVRYEVTSVPPGAPIEVDGVYVGDTPTHIILGTTKRWVGLAVASDGWQHGNEVYKVVAFPPHNSEQPLYSQTKLVQPQDSLQGGAISFDLRLESVHPTQPIEVRYR